MPDIRAEAERATPEPVRKTYRDRTLRDSRVPMANTTFMIAARMAPAWVVSTAAETSAAQVWARNGASCRARQGSNRRGRGRSGASSLQALQDREEPALGLHREGGNDRHEVLLGQGW